MGPGDLLGVGLPVGGAVVGFLGVMVEPLGGLLRLVVCDRIPSTTPGAEPPRDARILVQLGHIQRT